MWHGILFKEPSPSGSRPSDGSVGNTRNPTPQHTCAYMHACICVCVDHVYMCVHTCMRVFAYASVCICVCISCACTRRMRQEHTGIGKGRFSKASPTVHILRCVHRSTQPPVSAAMACGVLVSALFYCAFLTSAVPTLPASHSPATVHAGLKKSSTLFVGWPLCPYPTISCRSHWPGPNISSMTCGIYMYMHMFV